MPALAMASRVVIKRSLSGSCNAQSLLARSMATTSNAATKKHTFLVIIPDVPGTMERRFENRPTHLKNIYPNVENRSLKIGGPLFRSLPNSESAKPDIFGSAVIWAADSQQEVLDILKQDVYVQQGVWDFEKVQIYPFKPTFDHQFE